MKANTSTTPCRLLFNGIASLLLLLVLHRPLCSSLPRSSLRGAVGTTSLTSSVRTVEFPCVSAASGMVCLEEMYWRWLVYDVNTRGWWLGIEGFVLT